MNGKENEEVVELTLSYGNQGYYMTLLMPKNFDNFVECVDKYFNSGRSDSAYEYSQGISWDKEGLVKLSMPRFEMQSDFDLVDRLREMLGMECLEDETIYNILEGRGIHVNGVKQKSAIKVDEQGTVASAVTSVGSVIGLVKNFNVTIDRPFFYAIQETARRCAVYGESKSAITGGRCFLFSRQGKSCLLNVFKSAPQSALLTYGLVCGCFGRGRAVVFFAVVQSEEND